MLPDCVEFAARAFMGVRSVRILIGALGFLVLSGLLRPTSAWAQCGHYVVRGVAAEADRTDASDSLVRARSLSDQRPQESVPHPAPCSGPNCSRGGPVSPPLQTLTSPATEEWACNVLPSPPPDRSKLEPVSNVGLFQPVKRAAGIFHPPRLS
jgi:hypothetical protein